MRQIARRLKDGALELVEVAEPAPAPGQVSVRVAASLVSAGTERATMQSAEKNLLAKARERPEQVRQVLERALTEGPRSTYDLVRRRLEELGPLGYSAAGTVLEAGAEVTGVSPGDRVAIGGGGFANHAEVDVVPQLLCARVPENVSDEDAAFATLGAIAMHGLRRSDATVGSRVFVIGLGLVGQLAARIAQAAGCEVMGTDLDSDLVAMARGAGISAWERSDPALAKAADDTADAVLICASTSDDDPVRFAAQVARDRAPVVVVGAVSMDLPRGPYYGKELDLRLSRSYGPGRYDPEYELHGRDYPVGYVRWTQRRNMEAFLGLVARDKVRPSELVTHRFSFADAQRAYEALKNERPVAIVLEYETSSATPAAPGPSPARQRPPHGKPSFGLIGAGSFATSTIIPGLLAAGFEPAIVASASGLSAESARQRFGFTESAAGAEDVLTHEDLDLVVVATPHASHAELVTRALRSGRAVYVEKPLALSFEELAEVQAASRTAPGPLFVGFNRRYAPAAVAMRDLPHPRLMSYRVNAGTLAPDHWTNDLERGGGRLKGEGCHFIDFLCDQARADPVSVTARGYRSRPELALAATDNFSVQLAFGDGSAGTVSYAADAPVGPGKERFEVSAAGSYGVIDDFKEASIWTGRDRTRVGGRTQDKGFVAQFSLMAECLRGEREAPDAGSYFISTLATLAAVRSLETGLPQPVVSTERDDGPGDGSEPPR